MADGSVLSGTLAYLGFMLLAVVGPGVALPRLLRVRIDPALVLPTGLGYCALAYGFSLRVGEPWLFGVLVLALDSALLVPPWRWSLAEGPSLKGALPPFFAFVLVLAIAEYPQNRRGPDGGFIVDGLLPDDAAFHAGLAWELTLGYPPQVPGLSGFALDYHFGQPLVRAAALRWAGVHPYDSLSRFDNTLGALALILALRAAARALGAGALAQALVPWSLLAADLSFLLAWGRGVDIWLSLGEGSLGLFSLLHANSEIPALALGLGSLVALGRHQVGEGRGWLVLAGLLGLAVPFFKVFVAAQLLLGLGLALVLVRERLAVALAAAPVLLALAALSLGPAGGTMHVVFDPLHVLGNVRASMGLAPIDGLPLGLWALAWLVASLGLRLAGLPAAFGALASGAAPAVALSTMALSGWPLGLLFRVSPIEIVNRERPFNEALYFFEQSGIVLWLFTAIGLAGLRLRGLRAVAAAGLCAALALPSAVQFIVWKTQMAPQRISPPAVRAMETLAAATRPGDIVLEKPETERYPPPPMVLIGRRVAYTRYIPFLSQFAPRDARQARFERVSAFFRTTQVEQARAIAQELGARYVCLYGAQRVQFPTEGVLEPIFDEPGARVYLIK